MQTRTSRKQALTGILLVIIFNASAYAQKRFIISGTMKDALTGETLIGATVKIKEIPQAGTASNSYGFYSLSAPEGEYTLLFTYIGYETISRTVSLRQSQTINMALSSKSDLSAVVISSNRPNNSNITSPQMGLEKLNMAQINNVPVLMGEKVGMGLPWLLVASKPLCHSE